MLLCSLGVVPSESAETTPACLPSSTKGAAGLWEHFPKAFTLICLCSFRCILWNVDRVAAAGQGEEGRGLEASSLHCSQSCLHIAQKMKSVTIFYLQLISRSSTVCSHQLLCFCENVFLKQLIKQHLTTSESQPSIKGNESWEALRIPHVFCCYSCSACFEAEVERLTKYRISKMPIGFLPSPSNVIGKQRRLFPDQTGFCSCRRGGGRSERAFPSSATAVSEQTRSVVQRANAYLINRHWREQGIKRVGRWCFHNWTVAVSGFTPPGRRVK